MTITLSSSLTTEKFKKYINHGEFIYLMQINNQMDINVLLNWFSFFKVSRYLEGEQKKYTDVFAFAGNMYLRPEGFKVLNKLFIDKFPLKWGNSIINNLF